MLKLKIYPEIGHTYNVTIPDETYTGTDIEDFVDRWITENLNFVDHYTILENNASHIENPFCYVEICEREISEITFFETEAEAHHHMRQNFIKLIKSKSTECLEDLLSDNNIEYEDVWDDCGIQKTSAWINDLPVTHNNWDAHIFNLSNTNEKKDILAHITEHKYLFLNRNTYAKLLKEAFRKKVLIKNLTSGSAVIIIENEESVRIADNSEIIACISNYLNIDIVDIKETNINNTKGYSLICGE